MAKLNVQAREDVKEMMQTAFSAIASQTKNVALQESDALMVIEKFEDRKRKLELELEFDSSTNEEGKRVKN